MCIRDSYSIRPIFILGMPRSGTTLVENILSQSHLIEPTGENSFILKNIFNLFPMIKKKIIDPEKHKNRILEQMKLDLRLKNKPEHIECFDNSNLHGTNPVAACVVFKNGRPSKNEYRLYNIKDVVGIDDFASMKEVVFRRYKRLLDLGESLPQLVVVDGGKGQLSSALKAIESLGIEKKISFIKNTSEDSQHTYKEDKSILKIKKGIQRDQSSGEMPVV